MSAVHPAALEHVPFDGAEVLQRSHGQGDHAENGNRRPDIHRQARRHALADRADVPRKRQSVHGDRQAERSQEQRAVYRTDAADPGKVNMDRVTPFGLHGSEKPERLEGRFLRFGDRVDGQTDA